MFTNIMEKTGKDQFLESADRFFGRVANYLDDYEIGERDDVMAIAKLKELCDVVKITAMSIKALSDDGGKKRKPTMSKLASKASDSVV